ncbi:hypothetical protein HP532_25000 [Pseudomonas sp. CrR25]|nr:hypothetical protein [Pseudomonas sp. CrR25]
MANGRIGSIIGSMIGAWLIVQFANPQDLFMVVAIPALLGSVAIFSLHHLGKARRATGQEMPVTG